MNTFGQINTKLFKSLLLLIVGLLSLPIVTFAQSETPYDLVNAVNNLRALHGLEPYQIDHSLMAYAQEHSEYMASTETGTHIHSDGKLPHGLQENVASGDAGVVTVAVVVYEIWVSGGHRNTLIGYSTGDIGAGVALSDNDQVYYTVDVRPGEEVVAIPDTSAPIVPLETHIPNEDGSIIHIVGYGQTMWSIAQSYGVTVDDIRRLNALAGDSALIHPGQELIVRSAHTTTPTPQSETSLARTQAVTSTAVIFTKTMRPTEAVTPSPPFTVMSTSIPSDVSLKNMVVGSVVVLTIGIIGLLVITILGYRKSHDDK